MYLQIALTAGSSNIQPESIAVVQHIVMIGWPRVAISMYKDDESIYSGVGSSIRATKPRQRDQIQKTKEREKHDPRSLYESASERRSRVVDGRTNKGSTASNTLFQAKVN